MRGTLFDRTLVSSVVCSPCQVFRSDKMIRRSDPEVVQLMMVHRGQAGVSQNETVSLCPSGNLILYGSWRPYQIIVLPDEHNLTQGTAATIPYEQIPFLHDKLEQLSAVTFSGQDGIGALLAGFLAGLTTTDGTYHRVDTMRLGGILIDLLATLLAHTLERTSTLSPETQQQTLLAQTQAFIRQHLQDPTLTPSCVAAAHHTSVRTLQRLFQEHGHTVSGWIRHQRLEHCRRDLANPGLRTRPVHAIAMRWGFTDPAHFSRVFRSAYSLPPGEYRVYAAVEATRMSRIDNP
jgi:AraC-like DNA-binding protein